MGVPKFARYICERYPCIIELLNEYQIPEFDNLYLDMNGIIHCCSHPNDADAHFRITEETIFKNIFHYVEILFRTIKPQKLFFMAVDGVAPRAKINQQRGRRFRAAKEAELVEARARAKGEKIPEESRFDSNCITPGTLFMAKLTQQLKYFVTYKISTDKLWQKCKIILSGPEVPGEGEHKIMDYIRYMKSQPDYSPNTRHCLYGLDADLIMLSLCTHEPHFAVLREEVKYGKNVQKCIIPEKTKFCLLHISLLREYMEHEFESLKDKLKFPFDLEKIIDDWILMGFLVGNDFIPHLPNLHIANGALPVLCQAYKEILPSLDGYINEAGKLNLERFEKFMEQLAHIDVDHFAETLADLKYFEGKTGRRPNENERTSYRKSKDSPEQLDSPAKTPMNKDLSALIQATDEILLGHSDEEELIDTDSDNEMYNLEFLQHKRDYYMNKFDYESVDADIMRSQAEAYVTAIQWNLHYYYDGCCSWSWYYPHHYAPYISDIKGFKDFKLNFDLGKPFLPFQQLLAVLPAASRGLLPEAYQGLLTEEESPIIEYYPLEFRTDLNEKKQEWEAIVLIPFINEKKLIEAMSRYNHLLTPEEAKRNRHGPMSIITYTEENLGSVRAPDYFPSIESHALIETMDPKEIIVPNDKLVKGLCPDVKLHVYFSGFPTMQHIQHTVNLEKAKVKVFEQLSRGENMIITVSPKEAPAIEKISSELLGKTIYIKWPHLVEALVIGVSTIDSKFTLININRPYGMDNLNREFFKDSSKSQWNSEAKSVALAYKSRFGIDIGKTTMIIHACPISGRRYILSNQGRLSLEKEWSNYPFCYAYQTTVRDIEVEQEGFITHKNISDIYVPKSICFMLGHPHYGAMGEVIPPGINPKTGRVKVAMKFSPEPEFKELKEEQNQLRMQYMHGSIAAQRLGISSHLLSRITGSIFVLPERTADHSSSERKQQNIGLNLKFNKKNEELPGYTKKVDGQWLYSSKSIGLIRSYMEKYPLLFVYLAGNASNDMYNEDEVFANSDELTDVVKWLKEQPFRNVDARNCDEEGLDPEIVTKLQQQIDKYVEEEGNVSKTVLMQVKPHLLFKPELSAGNIPPDPSARTQIFDRIIAVKNDSSVPLGYKGTVVGIQGTDEAEKTYDVLFDKPFIGNISFSGGATCRRYKLLTAEFINISHGIRAEQDITGVGMIPEKINRKKQQQPRSEASGTSNSNNNAKSSAFASFNKFDNFLPLFCKNQSQSQAPQQQIRVMKKNEPLNLSNSSANNNNKNTSSSNNIKANQPPAPNQNPTTQKPTLPPTSSQSSSTPATPQANNVNELATEFQMLWNELQKPTLSGSNVMKPMNFSMVRPPAPVVNSQPQDPSAFLKAVLKISDDKPNNVNLPSSAPAAVNTNVKPFVFPPTPPVPPSAPPLVQQMFDHARQTNNRKESVSYCTLLLNHCQMMRIGQPHYSYSSEKNLVRAQVVMSDLRSYYGDLCSDAKLAAENVSMKVYKELTMDKVMKPQHFFDMRPPNAWTTHPPNMQHNMPPPMQSPMMPSMNIPNIQPPQNINLQSMMSPRSFPDPRKPHIRPPTSWNPMSPQGPAPFTQMPPMPPMPSMHLNPQVRPMHQAAQGPGIQSHPRPGPPMSGPTGPPASAENKPEVIKQSTPFVPLQAQKKNKQRKPKDTAEDNKDKDLASKTAKTKTITNSPKPVKTDVKPVNKSTNEQVGVVKDNPQAQKVHKAPRQRKSRIAANFGPGTTAANGNNAQ
ncbi:5'-3' exoribonuclease 1 isoform X1 [Microplitis mediator]|uniref:5'-3' exoribonuclease 1 isoform X1 n=1 Tax=Microplitis mediator TaxID=375433 RepID=UPI00255224FB|nr:5'-3' exoribonuclease 1 isoform X1 [Microplitis mediator]